ncbi:MAG: FAD-binding protein [Anaerolineales bacterium]
MKPTSIEELQEIIRTSQCLLPAGAGSKTALALGEDGADRVSSAALSGVLEYEPGEYTITVLAGTPVRQVERVLAENGQYLPFDPPLVEAGATLGGTVAAGLNGPGRYRFGGVRDSLLGVRFIDGRGSLVRSGGRVVKNAAGFDLSKFMVGSLGGYGFLVEMVFKVMPLPEDYVTLRFAYTGLEPALQALVMLTGQPLEIYALELVNSADRYDLLVRLGGAADSLYKRVERLTKLLGGTQPEVLKGAAELALLHDLREFGWVPAGCSLVKIPLTPRGVPVLDSMLTDAHARRVYSSGANLAWVAWPGEPEALDAVLDKLSLSGLVVLGSAGRARLGVRSGEAFAQRIKQALDPNRKFVVI